MKHVTAFAMVVALGCGGGPKTSETSNTADPATPVAGAQGVYGGAQYGGYKKSPELTAFHDLIANKTTPEACAISAELKAAAAAIVKAPSPLGNDAQEMWGGEANELAGITEDFVVNCAGTDAGAIEYDVASMNRSFQRLLLQLN